MMEYKSLGNPISRRTMVKFRATLGKAGSGFFGNNEKR